MAAVGKGSHFLQKNPPTEFSGYGPANGESGTVLAIQFLREGILMFLYIRSKVVMFQL